MMEKILSKKKKVHLLRNGYRFVFVCIYTLLYAYVYPYNHKNMCLGCPGRGPGTWEPLSSPKHHRNHEKLKGSENPPLSHYYGRSGLFLCSLRIPVCPSSCVSV